MDQCPLCKDYDELILDDHLGEFICNECAEEESNQRAYDKSMEEHDE